MLTLEASGRKADVVATGTEGTNAPNVAPLSAAAAMIAAKMIARFFMPPGADDSDST